MLWLIVLGLAAWSLVQHQRLTALAKRLEELSKQIVPRPEASASPQTVRRAWVEDSAEAFPQTPPEIEPERVAPPKPVLAEAAPPAMAMAMAAPALAPALKETPPEPPSRPRMPAASTRSVSDWLSENGLAWIGGGALALGGLLLVAYAAQRGFFTPALRIGAAVILGFTALATGEALRRGAGARLEPNRLVAALTTGAGAATLYAAIWAADLLYHFISPGAAGTLLATVSLGLLGLALLHGEALGLLAILAAYAVPVVTGGDDWIGTTLDGFILLILATGLGVSGLRRWGRAGLAALMGAGLWGLSRLILHDPTGVTLIMIAAPAFTLAALVGGQRLVHAETAPEDGLFTSLLTIAAIGACVPALILWVISGRENPRDAGWVTIAVIAVVAAGVRLKRAQPVLLWAPGTVLALTAIISASNMPAPLPLPIAWFLPAVAALALAGLGGAWTGEARRSAAVAGGAGAALSLTLAVPALAHALPGSDGLVDAAFAALFAVSAGLLAWRSEDPTTDWTPAAFIAAAGEATGLALHARLDDHAAPAAYALLALALAGLAVRIKWRGLAESAAVAALASLVSLLSWPLMREALSGHGTWPLILATAGAAALIQLAAWWTLKRRPEVQASAEAISTTALISALLGAFLALQSLAQVRGGAAPGLDPFTEASLRTLLLLAAGLMLAIRGAATPLGRIRAPVLLSLGAVHGLALQGLALHPWWGLAAHWNDNPPVLGPPLVDGLLLGLLAPGLLLLEAARRPGLRGPRLSGPAVILGLTFIVLWLISEIRRLFHGPVLDEGLFGYAETAAYAVGALGVALGLEALQARLGAIAASSREAVAAVLRPAIWTALTLALWLLAYVASPWWGPLDGDLKAPGLLGALYLVGVLLAARTAYAARVSGRKLLAQAALAATGIEVFALLTLAIRFTFHGAAMRAPLREASLETWTFSALWALYGLIALAVGAGRRDLSLRGLGLVVLLTTTAKVFLFDMARLEGVVRAASFLALGAVLLAAALAARRFAASAGGEAIVEEPGSG